MQSREGPGYRVFNEPREDEVPVVDDLQTLTDFVAAELRKNREAIAAVMTVSQDALLEARWNATRLVALSQSVETLAGALGVEVVTPRAIELIRFEYTLASGVGVRMYEPSPFAGFITEVKIHWPAGCAALVPVFVSHGTRQFCPSEGALALDNITPNYEFNEPVNKNEEICVDMANTGAFPHTITVTVSVKETRET